MVAGVSLGAYHAARGAAGIIDRTYRGRIVVSGPDRATFLQGLLTNDIVALEAGSGCYAAYLTAQGRMIADMYVYALGDLLLLVVEPEVKDALLAKFDQLIFSEDVRLGDVSRTFGEIAVVGPDAARLVSQVLSDATAAVLAAMPEHGNRRAGFEGQPVIVTRVADTGTPGFGVYVEQPHVERLRASFKEAGAVEIDEVTAEVLRVEGGVPRFHRDMNEETIPLEAGLEAHAISFSKGCYVGQEVIIRVLHRGHGRIARRLVGLRLEGSAAPEAGAVLRLEDRDVGIVTSAVMSPVLGQPIALGYVRRELSTVGTTLTVSGVRATVTELPFVR